MSTSNTARDEPELSAAVELLDPTNAPEPSAETGLGTHFNNTFDPKMRKEAPQIPNDAARQPAPKSAEQKLAATDSTMTTAQLQAAAQEGDPNGLLKMKKKY